MLKAHMVTEKIAGILQKLGIHSFVIAVKTKSREDGLSICTSGYIDLWSLTARHLDRVVDKKLVESLKDE